MTQTTMTPTNFEYAILTDTWSFGERGAAYNASREFCSDAGWIKDSANHKGYKVTRYGVDAIKKYQAGESHKKSKETM